MPMTNKKQRAPDWQNQLQYMHIQLAAKNIDVENRTVDVSITSETIARRWYGNLVLGHNPGECRLDRAKKVGSFLFAHGRDPRYGVMPVGQIVEIYLDEKARTYRAKLKFDEDEQAELLWQKVQSSSLRGISVGFRIHKYLEVPAGEKERGFSGPIMIVTDWEIVEVSLEPTPELVVGVGLSVSEPGAAPNAAGGDGLEINEKQEGKTLFRVLRNGVEAEVDESQLTAEERVTFGLDQATPAAAPQTQTQTQTQTQFQTPPAAESSAQVAAVERKRCTDIFAVCARFGVSEEERLSYINEGLSVEQVNSRVLDKLAAERTAVPSVQIIKDEREKFAAAATDGLALRAGVAVAKPADGANDFRGLRLMELARYCAERTTGKDLRLAGEEAVLKAAFGVGDFGQFMGTSDFPNILGNVATKSAIGAYEAAPTTYQLWTRKGNLPDFKAASRVAMGSSPDLDEILPNGEFSVAEITESGRTIKLGTYGKRWGLNRQAIINDDLDIFSRIPSNFAIAARRKINKAVYTLLTSSSTKLDNVALFDESRGNLATAKGAPSVATVGAGKAAMGKQKDLSGNQYLNIVPAYVLVPLEHEVTTAQLLASTVDPSKANATPNPFQNRLTAVADAELSGNSADAWYLAAAPGMADTIEVAFLNGNDRPIIETRVEFDVLGISWRIYIDYGVALLDYRGLYKNAGK